MESPNMMKTLKILAFTCAASLSFHASATNFGGINLGRIDLGSKLIVSKNYSSPWSSPVNDRVTLKSLADLSAFARLSLAAAYDKLKNAPSLPSHGNGNGHPGTTPGGCAPGGPVASAS